MTSRRPDPGARPVESRSTTTPTGSAAVGTVLVVVLAVVLTAVVLAAAFGTAVGVGATATGLSLGASLWCLARARSLGGRRRTAWLLLGSALVLWSGADALWLPYDLTWLAQIQHEVALLYGLGTPLAIAGLVLLPGDRWHRGTSWRVVLDVAVLTLPLLVVGLLLIVRPVQTSGQDEGAVSLVLWPATNVLLAGFTLVLARRGAALSQEQALVALAFVGWAGLDVWVVPQMIGSVQALPVAAVVPFAVPPLLLALAASQPDRAGTPWRGEQGLDRHVACRLVPVLPDVAIIAAGLVSIAVGLQTAWEWVLVALAALLAVVRFVVTRLDYERLRHGLERRVSERTADLLAVSDRLETIVASVDDGLVGLRRDGTIAFVSPAAARILRTTPEALLDQPACEALCGRQHTECSLCVAADLGLALPREEGLLKRGDGTLVPVEFAAAPVGPGLVDSELTCVATFRDISARQAVEQAKHQFVSTVSHELRTPLTAIAGALEMLADGDGGELPSAAAGLVASAERGVGRLGRLVDDILDAEAIASGRFGIVPRPAPLAPVAFRVAEALQAWAASHGVRLEVAGVQAVALVDVDRLEQALTNLVGNAVKFSSHGDTVRISAQVRDHDVLVEVADQGRGIPAAELPHVFDRFHQVVETDATEKGGAGLGLTITRSIVERHGGTIWVESQLGEGTTVRFTLPRPAGAPVPERSPVHTAV